METPHTFVLFVIARSGLTLFLPDPLSRLIYNTISPVFFSFALSAVFYDVAATAAAAALLCYSLGRCFSCVHVFDSVYVYVSGVWAVVAGHRHTKQAVAEPRSRKICSAAAV